MAHDPFGEVGYDESQLASSLELLRRRVAALEQPQGVVRPLLELVEVVRHHAIALQAHLEAVGAASSANLPSSVAREREELAERARALAERADALAGRERELAQAEQELGAERVALASRQAETAARERELYRQAKEHAESVSAIEGALAARADELARTEARMVAAETDLALRRGALEAGEAELARRAAEQVAAESAPAVRPELAATHLVFLPRGEGYAIVEREGPAPAAGAAIALDGRELLVTKVARSPLPADVRACVYVIQRG